MDISHYAFDVESNGDRFVNYNAEPVFMRVIIPNVKKDGETEVARTMMELIVTNDGSVRIRISNCFDNKVLMSLTYEEMDAWAKKWMLIKSQLAQNDYFFAKNKLIHKDINGVQLMLTCEQNPKDKNVYYIRLKKQSRVEKMLYQSGESVSLSTYEIKQLGDDILKKMSAKMEMIDQEGHIAMDVCSALWGRGNPSKHSPWYKPSEVTAGTGKKNTSFLEDDNPLSNTFKRLKRDDSAYGEDSSDTSGFL